MSGTDEPPRAMIRRIGIIIKGNRAATARTSQIKACVLHLRCTVHCSRSRRERRGRKRPEAGASTRAEYGSADHASRQLNFVRVNSFTQLRGYIRARASGNLTFLEAPGSDTGFANMGKLVPGQQTRALGKEALSIPMRRISRPEPRKCTERLIAPHFRV